MVDIRKSWDKIAAQYRRRYKISTDIVHYGPLSPGEDKLALLGNISGKKVIDLGCGCGQNAIALAKMGARVTAVDLSPEQIRQGKDLAAEEGVSVEFKPADITDLSFLPDLNFDLAVSACAIAFVENIESVFKEAFRLLKQGGVFVLSDMNPLQYIMDEIDGGVEFNNEYPFDPILMKWSWEFRNIDRAPRFQHYVRSISQYINSLVAAGFSVSKILEPKSTIDTPHISFSEEILEEYPYIARHLPITFIVVCRKP
jgi:ubiquinone/menaquinone biosynthesis C-methylase UbiE